ncbi:hypothetical protein BGLT_02659 [Caballeronia glathei]|nr:hypothetical protein BGLT_02659 [Caballeronia glathei]
MLMLQQRRETLMRVTRAVGDRGVVHVEPDRQRIDQQPQGLMHARLHAPEQHGAEHDVTVGVDRAGGTEHACPGEMAQARETHAELASLSAQARIEGRGQRQVRFGDGRAVMVDVSEAEGQRGFAHVGEHVAEEGFMRFLIRTDMRLCDQIAERLSRAERMTPAVEDRTDFRMHHFQRRMIADQVMPVQLHKPAPVFSFARNRDLQQGSLSEIEALRACIEMARQLLGGVAVCELDLRNHHRRLAPDHLSGRAQGVVDEGGAQDVMPLDDLLQGIEPCIETCTTVEGEARGLQIRIAFGAQHVVEQDAFLQRRERVDILHIGEPAGHLFDDAIDVGLRKRDERQHRWRKRGAVGRNRIGRHDDVGLGRAVFERSRERAEHGRGEQITHAGVQADAAQPLDERHGEQRVPAKGEEVVVAADALQAEQLGPQIGECDFGSAPWCFEGTQREGLGLRIGQRAAIELAVGGEGQRVEHDEGRGHHVVGQTRGEMLTQGAGVDLGNQRDIGDELLILRIMMSRTRDDHCFAHRRMAGDLRLDLTGFDAKSANLDLEVITAEEFDIAIEVIACEVAGTVDAFARNERIVEEALGGEVGPIQIATRHARTTDIEFAHRARRHHSTPRIEHISARVGERLADDGLLLFSRDLRDGRIHRALGRAIDVESADLFGVRQTAPGRRREWLAAHEHRQGRLPLFEQTGGEQRFKLSRRTVEYVDASCIEEFDQRHGIGAHVGRNDDQPMSGQQGGEVLHRRIECDAGVQRDAGVRGTMCKHRRMQCVMQIQHMPMLDHYALGLAGGAGRVDRVGKMMRGEAGHKRIVLRQCVIERCIGIEHGKRTGISQRLTARGIGDQQQGRDIAEDVTQPLARIGRIERDICAPGLEDREQRDDRADASLHAQRDTVFRTHAQRDQMMREPIGARIELRKSERFVVADERDCIGRESNLLLKELMDAQVLGIRCGGVVPAFEQRLSLGQHELERMQRRIGLVQRLFEKTREAARMGICGGGRIEQRVRVKHQFDAELVSLVMYDQREIIGCSIERAIQSDPAAGEIQCTAVLGHDVHGGTEERPVGFDASYIASNVFDAIALMAQDATTLPGNRSEQVDDARALVQSRAQRQCIGQHAGHIPRQPSHPGRDRKPEHHLGLSAQTRDIGGHDRRHELRPCRAVSLGNLPQTPGRAG